VKSAFVGLILLVVITLVILVIVFSMTYFRSTAGSIESQKGREEQIQNTIDQYQNKSKVNQQVEVK
jgi:Tfp pilus assembly protein PilO